MRKTISATEAVRHFSDLLNTVRFRGECYTIERGGKPVALFEPASPPIRVIMKDLPGLLSDLPSLGMMPRASRIEVELIYYFIPEWLGKQIDPTEYNTHYRPVVIAKIIAKLRLINPLAID